jgi:hypothetical protein
MNEETTSPATAPSSWDFLQGLGIAIAAALIMVVREAGARSRRTGSKK